MHVYLLNETMAMGPGSETVRHAADDDKNRVDTAALGRDAPPARRRQKWEPPS